MRTLLLFILSATSLLAQNPADEYPVHADSERHDGVPVGTVTKHSFATSKLYPGTTRDYWIYVPTQYRRGEPAALMVFQDGSAYIDEKLSDRVPIVFDNLIHKGEMPVTIGLFIQPGVVPAPSKASESRYNRSFEYDAFTDRYARFLLEEMIPLLEKEYNLTSNPNLRAVCGASSGGIAAFNAAWQRPDAFRRVYSTIGTFVGLRGGQNFPILVRKTEPKPLRIFLQDGSKDLNIYGGNWFIANQDMLSALEFGGYEVKHEWGEGGHSRKHGGTILPDVLRWLWEDWEKPITTHHERWKSRTARFLVDGEDWELLSEGHGFTEGPAVSPKGDLFFSDLPQSKIHRVSQDGKVSLFLEDTSTTNGLAFGPDGRLYGCRTGRGEIVAWNIDTKEEEILATGIRGNDLVVAHNGNLYCTEPGKKTVWLIRPGAKPQLASDAWSGVNGVTLSPDQTLLYAADFRGRYVWSAQVRADGSLQHVQPFFHMHLSPADIDSRSQADGLCVAKEGYLLVATAMGVQICDQPGRVQLILPPPLGARHPANLTFGGPDGMTLYATSGDKVFKRRIGLEGAFPWKAPSKPPRPRL